MKNSGACGMPNSIGFSWPSAPRAWMLASRAFWSGLRMKTVSFMPSGVKMALANVAVERQAAPPLDRLAGPVDVDAVLPLVAGVGDHRHLEGLELAAADAGDVGDLHVALDVLVPQVVAEARRVGQQMA